MKKSKHGKDHLPQTESEWIATGKFNIGMVPINQSNIRYALTEGKKGSRLVIMVGGIPRDPTRRQQLPLVNKLYGHLAIKMLDHGISSLLYNQPATGGSSGDWGKDTLSSRTKILERITVHFKRQIAASDVAFVGTSAGAYMAVNAIEELERKRIKVTRLALLSPAAYPKEAENVPYGETFTHILRTPWDVGTSPVFSRLQKFAITGALLISFFEVDNPPIPEYIQEYYRDFVRRLSREGHTATTITIPGVSHNFRRIGVAENKNIVDNDSIRATAIRLSEFLSN